MSSTTSGNQIPSVIDNSMSAVDETKYEQLILHSDHAFAISSGKINSLLHPKRLKKGTYNLSDGETNFGLITLTTRPTKVSSTIENNFSDKTTPMAEWWGNVRTLYDHAFDFKPIVDKYSILSNYKIDSTTFPARVYIIPQSMTGE